MLSRTTTSQPSRRATSRHQVSRRLRAGFTMIEILVVIIVISLLLALLIPALSKGKGKVNEARVLTEIKQLESAIGSFKAKFGADPPSRFVIYLTQAGWDKDPPAKGFIRRIWPQFNFAMPPGSFPAAQSPTTPDWNTIAKTDSNGNKYIGYNSGEALMFFLGGILDTNNSPMGFSKNPAMPFSPNGTNREGPFMEFDVARIRDSDSPTNGVPEYFDPLPNQSYPYLFFSSYEGRGYRRTELPQSTGSPAQYTLIRDFYRVFTGDSPNPPPPDPTAPTTGTSAEYPPYKPQTFQIISPGVDGQYGLGGAFNPNLSNGGLTDSRDYDNLTNFNGGRLVN